MVEARDEMMRQVDEMMKVPLPDPEIRVEEVNRMIEQFWSDTGTMPHEHAIRRLANYILIDYLTDQYKHYRGHEYPWLTISQLIRRRQLEISMIDAAMVEQRFR